jgi:SPP1 gp7 family putative phage head morphogenesis protein
MTLPPDAGAELREIFGRFMESSAAAAKKRKQSPHEEKYRKLIARRFRQQGKWFVDTILVQGRGTVMREADEPVPPTSAEILEAVAKMLRQLGDYPEDPALVDKLDATIRLALLTGAKEVMLQIRPSATIQFSLENARALAWLKDNAFSTMKAGLDATTEAALRTILEDGLAQGLSYSKIASLIRAKFTDMSRSRAQLIAVTEIGNAFSEGTLASGLELQASGIRIQKKSLTAGDDRVDGECADNEAAGWIAIEDDFPSGDARPLYHPNCRCALQLRRAPVAVPEPVFA